MKTYVYYVMFLSLNERTVLGTAGQNRVNDSHHFTVSACPFVTSPSHDTPCSFSIWVELMMRPPRIKWCFSATSHFQTQSQEPPPPNG